MIGIALWGVVIIEFLRGHKGIPLVVFPNLTFGFSKPKMAPRSCTAHLRHKLTETKSQGSTARVARRAWLREEIPRPQKRFWFGPLNKTPKTAKLLGAKLGPRSTFWSRVPVARRLAGLLGGCVCLCASSKDFSSPQPPDF